MSAVWAAAGVYLAVVLVLSLFFVAMLRRQPPPWVGADADDADDLADIDGGDYPDDGVFREAPAASGVWGVGQW